MGYLVDNLISISNKIGVDLGGTNVRAGLVQKNKLVSLSAQKIRSQGSQGQVFEDLCQVISEVWTKGVRGIGVGVPSLVDPETGIIHDTTNIPTWTKFPLKKKLEAKFKVSVRVDNDANCFTLGEKQFGQGQNCQNMVGLILGTGLGAGIISNGRLHSGWHCGAGEFGTIPYLKGTIENYASGQFFANLNRTGEELFLKAQADDKAALKIFENYGIHLGKAIKIILYALAPEMIVLGGSVSHSLPYFKLAMNKELESFAYPKILKHLKIRPSKLKHGAILGAASL